MWLSLRHWWQISKNCQFIFHQKLLWTRKNEVVTTPPKTFMTKGWSFFCQVPLSQKKCCEFFEKEINKTVQWTSRLEFWHNRGNKSWKANVFCPMSQNDMKEKFFPKTLFFSEKPCFARIDCIFDKPASFFKKRKYIFFNNLRWKNRKKQKWGFS